MDKLVLKDIAAEMISVQFVDRTVADTATAPRSRSVLWPIFVLTFSLDPTRPAGWSRTGGNLFLCQDLGAGCAGKGERYCQPEDAAEAEDECLIYCMLDTRVTCLDCGESRALLLDRLSFWRGKGKLIKPATQVVSEGCKQHQPKDRNGE